MDDFQLQPLNSLESSFINAVCQSVFWKLQNIESKELSDHFKTFEIMKSSDLDDIQFFLLNSLFKEISINAHMCQPYIGDVDESTILQIVNSENHELSWILPTALCNVLKLPIILFTKLPHFPVIPLLPADLHLKEKSSYIYIRHFGKLKFDALVQKKYQTLSPLDENYVPTSKKANLEYQPKTSSSL